MRETFKETNICTCVCKKRIHAAFGDLGFSSLIIMDFLFSPYSYEFGDHTKIIICYFKNINIFFY